jgi:hypothetical protein
LARGIVGVDQLNAVGVTKVTQTLNQVHPRSTGGTKLDGRVERVFDTLRITTEMVEAGERNPLAGGAQFLTQTSNCLTATAGFEGEGEVEEVHR